MRVREFAAAAGHGGAKLRGIELAIRREIFAAFIPFGVFRLVRPQTGEISRRSHSSYARSKTPQSRFTPPSPAPAVKTTAARCRSRTPMPRRIPTTKKNSKLQIPNSKQTPNSKHHHAVFVWRLEFDIWNLFGVWGLRFGVSLRRDRPP